MSFKFRDGTVSVFNNLIELQNLLAPMDFDKRQYALALAAALSVDITTAESNLSVAARAWDINHGRSLISELKGISKLVSINPLAINTIARKLYVIRSTTPLHRYLENFGPYIAGIWDTFEEETDGCAKSICMYDMIGKLSGSRKLITEIADMNGLVRYKLINESAYLAREDNDRVLDVNTLTREGRVYLDVVSFIANPNKHYILVTDVPTGTNVDYSLPLDSILFHTFITDTQPSNDITKLPDWLPVIHLARRLQWN